MRHSVLTLLLIGSLFAQGCLNKDDRQFSEGFSVYLQNFKYEKMRTWNDCGIVAQHQTLSHLGYDYTYEQIKDAMGWHNKIGNVTDTQFHHMRMLNKFDIDYKFAYDISYNDIIERLRLNIPTVVLINTGKFRYHWIVITGYENGDWITAYGSFSRPYRIPGKVFSEQYNGTAIIYKERK